MQEKTKSFIKELLRSVVIAIVATIIASYITVKLAFNGKSLIAVTM